MSQAQFQAEVMDELRQQEETIMKTYADLRRINVNEHTEKKGNLTYLSWAWAVDQLLLNDPTATWEYGEPVNFGDTMMVFCQVNAFGKSMTAQLPVMDYKNKAILNPDAMAVNTAMQRCLAKAIALHGLGLYLYAGEDLPDDSNKVQPPNESAKSIAKSVWDEMSEEEQSFLNDIAMEMVAAIDSGDVAESCRLFYGQNLTQEEQTALWSRLDSKQRASIKKYRDSLKEK
jgi:hypothetical protein